jgi:hypothetical protein
MALVKFYKVSSLPAQLNANSFYYVENGNYAESYVTNNAGVAKAIGNSVMINALIDTKVNAALADFNAVQIVADIAARNALASGAQRNLLVLVTNATGDTTVASGAAMYAYNETGGTWTKLTEYESMDVTISWAMIQNKPTSTVTEIDDAVAKKHTHANKTVIDKLGSDSEGLLYDSGPILTRWSEVSW